MRLRGKLIIAELEQRDDFACKLFSCLVSLRVEHDLSDQFSIWLHHCHLPEELFEVFGKIRTASVSRIHGYKGSDLWIQLNILAHQLDLALPFSKTSLDDQNLLRAGREHTFLQSVELVEAAPSSDLAETDEDTAHCVEIEGFIAVEHQHEETELRAESLYGLCFSCSCGTKRRASHSQMNGLGQGQEAAISKWSLHEFLTNSEVLETIMELRISHLDG